MQLKKAMFIALSMLLLVMPVWAQGDPEQEALPASAMMSGFRHEYQGWNNCGPATLTTAMSYFGWEHDQYTAAQWLKPDPNDKNVSAWQMAAYVNTQTPYQALVRFGGDLTLLQRLVAGEFPVIVAAGFEPESYDWMGHYLLVMGYDQDAQTVVTQDSFMGPDTQYDYEEFDHYWRHFNRVYIVVFQPEREQELLTLLGEDADAHNNLARALDVARAEVAADTDDPFGWFNMGTNYAQLGMFAEAATAFDQARNAGAGLPWRMLWYQFDMFEAYYQVGRYEDVISLVQVNLATTAEDEHPIEETYYYAGLAREAMGETQRARSNYQQAVNINRNFTPAVEALQALDAASESMDG